MLFTQVAILPMSRSQEAIIEVEPVPRSQQGGLEITSRGRSLLHLNQKLAAGGCEDGVDASASAG